MSKSGGGPVDIEVTGTDDMKKAAETLQDAARRGDLVDGLVKELPRQSERLVRDLRSAVLQVQTRTSGSGSDTRPARSTGLRQAIADAIEATGTQQGQAASLRIRVDLSKLPPDQRGLPGALENPQGWRHPVFGNADVVVTQYGQPWFETTIRRHTDQLERAVGEQVDKYAQKLEDELK